MKTPEQVAAIEDPMERMLAARDLLDTLEAKAEAARAARALAVISWHRDLGASGASIYQRLKISRGTFKRILDREPADRQPVKDPEKKAVAEHKKRLALMEPIAKVAKIRTEAAILLMSGDVGPPVSNADIARATGLTTARVAQIRNGGA